MWDKPHLLRMVSSTLFGISLVLALYGALHYALHLPVFPLRAVQLSAAPHQVNTAQIEAVVRDEVRGNFFTVDLESARHAFERLPWVRKVSVRRHFPWRLEVNLEEHVALAHWNGKELVNTHGEVFAAESVVVATSVALLSIPHATCRVVDCVPLVQPRPPLYGETDQMLPRSPQDLPKFFGQPGTAAEVAQMYGAFGEQLAPLKQGVAQISLSPRHAWQLRLNNGMVLELGREQSLQRLARFVAVYPYSLAPMQQGYAIFNAGKAPHENGQQRTVLREGGGEASGHPPAYPLRVNYVDLRYHNGFAAYLPGVVETVKGKT